MSPDLSHLLPEVPNGPPTEVGWYVVEVRDRGVGVMLALLSYGGNLDLMSITVRLGETVAMVGDTPTVLSHWRGSTGDTWSADVVRHAPLVIHASPI